MVDIIRINGLDTFHNNARNDHGIASLVIS